MGSRCFGALSMYAIRLVTPLVDSLEIIKARLTLGKVKACLVTELNTIAETPCSRPCAQEHLQRRQASFCGAQGEQYIK